MGWTNKLVVIAATIVIAFTSISAQAAISAHQALNATVSSANLDNVPLATVIDYIRDATHANMHVNWKALEVAGVGKDALVNLRLRNVSVHQVLELALDQAGAGSTLTFYVDEGVIEITTREIADATLVTCVYPMEDLLIVPPDFTDVPDFNITSNTQSSGGGGIGGGGSGGGSSGGNSQGLFGGSSGNNSAQPQQLLTKNQIAQQLIDLIVRVIQPDIWQANGGQATIDFFNGSLIVHAPRSVQEALGGATD